MLDDIDELLVCEECCRNVCCLLFRKLAPQQHILLALLSFSFPQHLISVLKLFEIISFIVYFWLCRLL
jgi:hypothetical protein